MTMHSVRGSGVMWLQMVTDGVLIFLAHTPTHIKSEHRSVSETKLRAQVF